MKRLLCLLIAVFLSIPALSAEIAARVIIAKGTVVAQGSDGNRALKRRSEVFRGDVIRTGPASSVQLRFVDKALMTIKANSELNIEEYVVKSDEGSSEQALLTLVKGGFRTITGSIGKGDKSAYKVSTPAASIGIRGTAYEIAQESGGSFIIGVYGGGIRVENQAGSIDLGLDADYNYSRVSPNAAPKGLLSPPPSFGLNTATKTSEKEESDDNSEDAQEGSDDTEKGFADSEDENNSEEQDELFSDNTFSDDDTDLFANVDQLINDAVDTKLADTIEQTTEETISNLEFDFNNPYAGIDTSNTTNPFDTSVISDEAYALGESGQLAFVAIPSMFDFSSSSETPTTPLLESQLFSPNNITNTNIGSVTYDQGTRVEIRYSILEKNASTGNYDTKYYHYEISIGDTGPVSITNVTDLTNVLVESPGTLYVETETGREIASETKHFLLSIDQVVTGEYKVSISPDSSLDPSQTFLSSVELDIFGTDANKESEFYRQIGSTQLTDGSYNDRDWYTQSELEVFIGNGSWDTTTGQPILLENEEEPDGTTRLAIIKKNKEDNQVVESYLAYTGASPSCGGATSNLEPCDIQVKDVGGRSNIRWGAWITEPDEPITITENENGSLLSEEENAILAFWITAERADINQLSGTASFTANNLDCTDLSQCMGFADDGVVTSFSGNFAVDFNNSTISEGSINIDVSDSVNGSVVSQWDVSFQNAQMKGVDFHTNQISGSVKDSAGAIISSNVVGSIGGLFVKPGDKAVGGYNFGALDSFGSHKHTTGVFQLNKQ